MVVIIIVALRAVVEHLDKVGLFHSLHLIERWDIPSLQPAQDNVLNELAGFLVGVESISDSSVKFNVSWQLGFYHSWL